MPRKQKTLRVCINPFVHLDHEGRPAAKIGFDPDYHSPDFRHLGMHHKAEILEARAPIDLKTAQGDARPSLQDTWHEYDAEPFTIPDTLHYRQQMRGSVDGSPALLPANAETARAIGVPFADPSAIIVATAKAKLEQWKSDHDGEIPEWATATPEHPSHATHAQFLAAHAAKLTPAPVAESEHDHDHDGGHS